MLRTGTIQLKGSNQELFLLWSGGTGVFERLDIIEDINDYSIVDTSNCVAAYYRDTSEQVYGDENIIRTAFKIKHEASLLHASEKTDVSIDGKDLVLTTSKESPELGLRYSVILRNGSLEKEEYVTPDGVITILRIDPKLDNEFKPTNLVNYERFGSELVKRTSSKVSVTAEFYSYDELLRMYPQVTHVLDNDYVVIESYEEAVERLNIWKNSKEKFKSYDIESYHEEWGIFSDNRITGVFLGYGETWSTYFPFRQDNFEYNLPIEFLKEIFEAINNQPPFPEVILIGHNLKFETEGFYQEFRDFIRVDIDTYLLAVLVNPKIGKGTHTLKALAAQADGRFYLSLEHIFIGQIRFNVLPKEIVKLYGCPDATSPVKVYKMLINKLPKDEQFVLMLENRLVHIKAMNEFYGLPMNQERLNKLIENEQFKVNLLGDKFRQIHKTSRNINSNQVLKEILYDRLRCPVEVRTNKGQPATSVVAINRIVDLGTKKEYDKENLPAPIKDINDDVIIAGEDLAKNKYPSLVIYQKYKKCIKELGALNRLKKRSKKDRFMFYINQVGAGSNRQTSDAHQFSDTMKSCAVADSPQHGLVSCDWKQVELRILAWRAGQDNLMKLMYDPDVDIHRAILSIIQGEPIHMISEEDRKSGKAVNFGVVYMMSEYGLAARDFGPAYTREQLNVERKKITDFFNGLPKIKYFMSENERTLNTMGYIKTAFNYYRFFPELLDPTLNSKTRKTLIRAGNNTPIQGTGAQMLKMVECKVWDYIREKGWHKERDYNGVMLPMVRMILPIHDEILLSYDKSIPKEEIIKMFKECMELDIEGAPPFFAAPAFIENWYQGKDDRYEVDIPLRDKIVENYEKGVLTFSQSEDDYLQVLSDFRDISLKEYMGSLISKYKTREEVWKHVDHPAHTHTLISAMLSKKERKNYTHIERIEEATRRFMDKLELGGELTGYVNMVEATEEDYTMLEDTDEWLETYSRIDQFGNLIQEEPDEYAGLDDVVQHELLPIEDRVVEKSHVIYMMQECWIDLTDYDITTDGEKVHQGIQKLADPNEWYEVVYIIGRKAIRPKLKVGHIPQQIEDLFKNL